MDSYKEEKLFNEWLNANGLDEKSFTVFELPFIQAQQVAHCLMKFHAVLLNESQTEVVTTYLEEIKHKAKRRKLTATKALKVLNIGTKINRQIFKKNRATNKGR